MAGYNVKASDLFVGEDTGGVSDVLEGKVLSDGAGAVTQELVDLAKGMAGGGDDPCEQIVQGLEQDFGRANVFRQGLFITSSRSMILFDSL
jgi:hypothetical protein